MALKRRPKTKIAFTLMTAATALGLTRGQTAAFDTLAPAITLSVRDCMDQSFKSGIYKDTFRQYAPGAKGAAAAFTAQCLIENQPTVTARQDRAHQDARKEYLAAKATVERDSKSDAAHAHDHVSEAKLTNLRRRANMANAQLGDELDNDNGALARRLAVAEDLFAAKARPGMETDIVRIVFDIARKPEMIAHIDAAVPPQNAQTTDSAAKSANQRAFALLNPAIRWAFHQYPQDIVAVAAQTPASVPLPPAKTVSAKIPPVVAAVVDKESVPVTLPPVEKTRKEQCPAIRVDFTNARQIAQHNPLRHPLAEVDDISSSFGIRMHPIFGRRKMHTGLDLRAAMGTPIYAAASGIIETIGTRGGYGRYIEILHNGGLETAYGHMSRFAEGLHDGSRVKRGAVIGFVGATGWATGPHLHYEVRVNGEFVDPKPFLLSAKALTIQSDDDKCQDQMLLSYVDRPGRHAPLRLYAQHPTFRKISLD